MRRTTTALRTRRIWGRFWNQSSFSVLFPVRCMMKRLALTAMMLVTFTGNGAQAGLRAGPEITSVLLDPTDPDKIAIRLSGLDCETAISTDAGQNFRVVAKQDFPSSWSSNLIAGTRRYVLADSIDLLRSDDSGLTWTKTGALDFLREQCKLAEEEEQKWFREEYGPRLPLRSSLWHILFAVFAATHLLLCFSFLRRDGSLRAILIGLRALVVLSLVWALLGGLHAIVRHNTDTQYPEAFWNSSMRACPSPKLGIVMAIAALPLPLMAYLAILWPILPGSVEILTRLFPKHRRLPLVISVIAGITIVMFHACLMLIGCFWE